MSYIPQVDDYVKWKNHEGWVYFKCDQSISIEIRCMYVIKYVNGKHGASSQEKSLFACCSNWNWDELVMFTVGDLQMRQIWN